MGLQERVAGNCRKTLGASARGSAEGRVARLGEEQTLRSKVKALSFSLCVAQSCPLADAAQPGDTSGLFL